MCLRGSFIILLPPFSLWPGLPWPFHPLGVSMKTVADPVDYRFPFPLVPFGRFYDGLLILSGTFETATDLTGSCADILCGKWTQVFLDMSGLGTSSE